MSILSKIRRIRNIVILKMACLFFLIGFLLSLSFFINVTGGTMFLFNILGVVCFLIGISLFLWFLYRDFSDRHSFFEEVFLPKGTLVFEEGTVMNSVCLVTKGKLQSFQGNGKHKKPLCLIAADDKHNFIGELSVMPGSQAEEKIWSESVYVVSEGAELIFIGKGNFSKLAKKVPLIGNPLLAAFEEKQNKYKDPQK